MDFETDHQVVGYFVLLQNTQTHKTSQGIAILGIEKNTGLIIFLRQWVLGATLAFHNDLAAKNDLQFLEL